MKRPSFDLSSLTLSREFSIREKVLFVILAAMLLVALYVYVIFLPVRNTVQDAQSETEAITSEITILEAEKANLDNIEAELNAALSNPQSVSIPSYDNLELLMSFLNGVLGSTQDYSLSFPGLDMPSQEEGGNIVRRYMQLTFTAPGYYAARGVINRLQSCPYRCQLNEMSITPANQDAASLLTGPVQASVSMVFFETMK